MTVPLEQPAWPSGDPGKVLLHFVADCNVDALFEDFFGVYPELQAKLHRQRNDTNMAESPWVDARAQLPQQQFMWPAPPAGADPGVAAPGSCRKVRFEAAPSLASKAFSSEEVQTLLSCSPGSHYLVESEVSTSAMYGDQFCIISRYTLLGTGPSQTHLHLAYAINFKPSLNRLVRPMVAKGVDGGIRGTFGLLRKLLQEKYTLTDLPDTAAPPRLPEAANLAAAAAAAVSGIGAATEAAPVAQVPAAAAAAASAPLFGLADYIVYQELVASLLTLPDPRLVAQGLAMCLTLALIQLLIAVVKPISQACHATAAAADQSGVFSGLSGLVCWPVLGLFDVPDNVLEVVSSMLLVAVANKLLITLVELAAAMVKASTVPATNVPPSAADALQTLAEATLAQPSTAAGTGQAVGVGPAVVPGGVRGRGPSFTSPVPIPSRALDASPGAAGGAGGSSGGGELLSQVVNGWGKMVDSLSSNEGFKGLLGGGWLRPDQPAKQELVEAQQGARPAAAAPLTERLSSRGSLASRPSHRYTTSFTAVMDPLGLNIIEDYAKMEAEMLPRMEEGAERSAHSSPATAAASLLAAADDGTGSAAADHLCAADGAAVSPRSYSLPALQSPAGSDTPKSRSSSPSRPPSRLSHGGMPATAAVAGGNHGVAAAPYLNGKLHEPPAEGTARHGSRSATPTPVAAAVSGLLTSRASSAPPHPPGHQQQQQQSKAVKIRQSKEAPEQSSSGVFGSFGSRESPGVLLSRRSASPVVYGELATASSSNSLGSRGGGGSSNRLRSAELAEASGASYEALAGAAPYVAPGDEDEDEVLVEVFEHERVQPFRGWGHTWPGHFLPSDKVGHWGDRQGAPGGDASMLFDRVAPKLPAGWAWKDAEWQVDMAGDQGAECCDTDGWSYGMDFSWLQWPPPPQSGKAGLKSFVRRRRWVRTRMRLPPGCFEEQLLSRQEAQEDSLLGGLSSSRLPLQELSAGGSIRRVSTGGSEMRLIAGLGSGLGLGAEGGAAAAATAAAAAASAMYSRFLRAVEDTVTGSGGGAATSSDGSPAEAAAAAAAATTAKWDVPEPDQPSGQQMQQQSGEQVAGDNQAAHTAAGATAASSSSTSSTSNGAPSESGNESDSDSSSVDSIRLAESRPWLSVPLEAAHVAGPGTGDDDVTPGQSEHLTRQHEQPWQARRLKQQQGAAPQQQDSKQSLQSLTSINSADARRPTSHGQARAVQEVSGPQQHPATDGPAGPAAAVQETVDSQDEPGPAQPAVPLTAATPNPLQHFHTSPADASADQDNLPAGSAAAEESAADVTGASQQPGAVDEVAEPEDFKVAPVLSEAALVAGGSAAVPGVTAFDSFESVAGLESASDSGASATITPGAAAPGEHESGRTSATAGASEPVGAAPLLHEHHQLTQPWDHIDGGGVMSAAASSEDAVTAASGPAESIDDIQPSTTSGGSVGRAQQQGTAAAQDPAACSTSQAATAGEQAAGGADAISAAAGTQGDSSCWTAGGPRQLRLTTQGSRNSSQGGSTGSITPTVASNSPSSGSGQRSSTLRPRRGSASGSKPAGKKLGAVPLRHTADSGLHSSGSGRVLSPQTSNDGTVEATEISRGQHTAVDVAATIAPTTQTAVQTSNRQDGFEASDVAGPANTGCPLDSNISDAQQQQQQQGDVAAVSQSGVGTAAGTAVLDDSQPVGSSSGGDETGADLGAVGSRARVGDVPAVGMSAADEGEDELGSGLTSRGA